VSACFALAKQTQGIAYMSSQAVGAFLAGLSIAGFSTMASVVLAGRRRLVLAAILGLLPIGVLLAADLGISLPYLLVIALPAAAASVPLAALSIFGKARSALACGATGAFLAMSFLMFIQYDIGKSLAPWLAPLAYLFAAAAGFSAGCLADRTLAGALWLAKLAHKPRGDL
jgi:hypothetical protein